jgi:periplasmic divalent cation tolerance protein
VALRIVLSNCSPAEAPQLAKRLVESKLAACVNVIPGIRSFYFWDGHVVDDEECTLLIKTTEAKYGEMKAKLEEWHSYSVPEIVSLTPEDVLKSYGDWAAAYLNS